MTLGEKILQLRHVGGLSQEQLGDRLGVSRQAVSKWELNESVPDLDKLIQLGKVFGVTMDELLTEGLPAAGDNGVNETEAGTAQADKSAVKKDPGRVLAAGLWTTAAGLVLLGLESLLVPVTKVTQTGDGNPTVTPLMPLVMVITGLVALVGVGLVVYGLAMKRRQNRN